MKLFVLMNVPGAGMPTTDGVQTADWKEIYKIRDMLFVDHEPYRELSRWTHADRKRPFVVRDREFNVRASSATLKGAIKSMKKLGAYLDTVSVQLRMK